MLISKLNKALIVGFAVTIGLSLNSAKATDIGDYESQIKNLSAQERLDLEAGKVVMQIQNKMKGFSWHPLTFYAIIPSPVEVVAGAYWDAADAPRYNPKIKSAVVVSREKNKKVVEYTISVPIIGSSSYSVASAMNFDSVNNSYRVNVELSKSSYMKKSQGNTVMAAIDSNHTLIKLYQVADPAWTLSIIPGSQSKAREEAKNAFTLFIKNAVNGPNRAAQIKELNRIR